MTDHETHVTLTDEATVEFVRSKVRSGEYASEADVVRDVISTWQENEAELESWLKEEIVQRCAELDANPSAGLTVEEVRAHLAEARKRRAALAS